VGLIEIAVMVFSLAFSDQLDIARVCIGSTTNQARAGATN
jgi:hypothetical protein